MPIWVIVVKDEIRRKISGKTYFFNLFRVALRVKISSVSSYVLPFQRWGLIKCTLVRHTKVQIYPKHKCTSAESDYVRLSWFFLGGLFLMNWHLILSQPSQLSHLSLLPGHPDDTARPILVTLNLQKCMKNIIAAPNFMRDLHTYLWPPKPERNRGVTLCGTPL